MLRPGSRQGIEAGMREYFKAYCNKDDPEWLREMYRAMSEAQPESQSEGRM